VFVKKKQSNWFISGRKQCIHALTWQPGKTARTLPFSSIAISCQRSEDLNPETGISLSVITCHLSAQKNIYFRPSGAIVQFNMVIIPLTASSGGLGLLAITIDTIPLLILIIN
jgi:hypothetical protein